MYITGVGFVLLAVLYLELIMIGVLLTMPKTADKVVHNADLGLKIVCTFFLWASHCGRETYTITSTYEDETKTITFGR